jgi:hypothetical protein
MAWGHRLDHPEIHHPVQPSPATPAPKPIPVESAPPLALPDEFWKWPPISFRMKDPYLAMSYSVTQIVSAAYDLRRMPGLPFDTRRIDEFVALLLKMTDVDVQR